MTEFGSNMSTILSDGEPMLPSDPLDMNSDWVCEKTGAKRPAEEVKEEMARIGVELQVIFAIYGWLDDEMINQMIIELIN